MGIDGIKCCGCGAPENNGDSEWTCGSCARDMSETIKEQKKEISKLSQENTVLQGEVAELTKEMVRLIEVNQNAREELQSEVKRLKDEVERLKTANGTDENGRPIHYDVTGGN